MRLIDLDDVDVEQISCSYSDHTTLEDVKEWLDEQPTISPDSLVKRGRWIEKPFLLGTSNFCSLCDSFYGMPHGKFKYCPNCGARMDLEPTGMETGIN